MVLSGFIRHASMINVSTEELTNILAIIDNVLAMHEQWHERLQRTLICKLPPEPAFLAEDAHRFCQFGLWFYNPQNAHLRKLESFRKLEELHWVMHDMARELCTSVKGHWAINPNEYDPFIAQLTAFRAELASVRRKVEETLHTIDPLTGAFRSEQLLPDLRRAQEALNATGAAYSLLLLDFDLTPINRAHGHDTGDAILRAGVRAIRECLGSEDRVYRHTGAEFVICLPDRDREAAEAMRSALTQQITMALSRELNEVKATLPMHYAIVTLEPRAQIERLISQANKTGGTIQI